MRKLIFSAFIAFALIAAQVGTVFAQDTIPAKGTVMSVEIDETTDDTTVLVTYSYVDETGATQLETVRLDLAMAEELDLVETNDAGETTVIFDPTVGAEIEIGLGSVVDDTAEEDQHPVGSALADFFGDLLGVNVAYDTIMIYRNNEDGENGNAGFGVIAQALWMTAKLQNDNSEVDIDGNLLFQQIVDAKLYKDYNIELENGTIIEADNWGQFKKEILKGESDTSVGDVMSGRNDPDEGETSTDQTGETISNQNENGNQNGSSGNNDGNENGNKNKNKDKGNKGKGHQ